jgi:hypothetical protein
MKSPEEDAICEMAGTVALQGPLPLFHQYEEAVVVGAIIVTQLAGYQEMVLVVMLHSTTIMEVTAVVLILAAMLCCHHSNTLPRLVSCSRVACYATILIFFSYFSNQNFVFLALLKHAACPHILCVPFCSFLVPDDVFSVIL